MRADRARQIQGAVSGLPDGAARPINLAVWLPVIIGAVVAGLGIGWLLGEGVDLPGPPTHVRPSLGLGHGERAAAVYLVRAPLG